MGRRKERRLAAISAAGRRVKLDLFAEPSGDLGDSSVREGVGGGGDSSTHTELPNSPSSSGQKPQNPLLLLEQYSDEESEGGSTGGNDHTVSEDASNTENAAIGTRADTEINEDIDAKEDNDQIVGQLPVTNGSASQVPSENHKDVSILEASDDLKEHTNKMEESTCATATDGHLVGDDVSCGWKMVLHEDSNQYYYWNTVTGETSWNVPDVFAQETVISVEKADDNANGNIDAVVEMDKPDIQLDNKDNCIVIRNAGIESKGILLYCDGSVASTKVDNFHEEFSGDRIDCEEGNMEGNCTDVSTLLGKHFVENKTGAEFPSQLIKKYEGLLERLNSVKGLNCSAEDKDLKLKCTLEIEIRLTDIKALASHGPSLLMFWLYSEGQLKRLEAAVDDAVKHHCSASPSEFDAGVDSSFKRSFAAKPHTEHNVKLPNLEALNDIGVKNEITVAEKGTVVNPDPAHLAEDIDMDVDMEVEDTSSLQLSHKVASSAHDHVLSDLSNLQNKNAAQETMVSGQVLNVPAVDVWIPPPPPDSEPFPPPPPDDEPFLPPPPDEPPETSYPSSCHLGPVQQFPYPEQYAAAYSVSTHDYYGQPNLEVSGSTLYAHPDAGQAAVSHVPHYYEAVPNMYGVSSIVVNPVDPIAYYGPQNASLNHIPLISGVEASVNPNEPVFGNLDSGKQDSHMEGGPKLLSECTLNAVESDHGNVMVPTEVDDAQPAVGATEASSVVNGVSVSSSSDTSSVPTVAAAAAAAASKAQTTQTKSSRNKKRAVAVSSSLRSNKKVSSLVDKWKAAKEELQEEEEEPLDAYEVLERKRQREIEEWRAQQIASGEAKDNANFQPLGGDWRERVKRKRMERMKEKEPSPSDVPDRPQQQIDLLEHLKDLPSGWKAYWDDSSKQVYYGNVLTSETTWTRPAD